MPSSIRKTKTPARASRMEMPALSARAEKTRSPGRPVRGATSTSVVVTVFLWSFLGRRVVLVVPMACGRRSPPARLHLAARSALGGDLLDDGRRLVRGGGGQRSRAGVLGRGLLALLRGDVGEVGLDQ